MKKLIIASLLLLSTVTFAQDKKKCQGTTKAGVTCSRNAAKESNYCFQHNPASAHCAGTTKAGKQCSRIVKKQGDYCFNHKKN